MTNSATERLVKCLAGISTLCELIIIYYFLAIKGTRFKKPAIEDRANKIKKFAEYIKNKDLAGYIKVKDDFKETLENEHSLYLWEIFDHFLFADTESLRQFSEALREGANNE